VPFELTNCAALAVAIFLYEVYNTRYVCLITTVNKDQAILNRIT